MNDTSEKMADFYQQLLMKRSPQERLEMGCSMFDTAKEIVKSSILERNPKISVHELKRNIFKRFYAQTLSESQLQKILNIL